MIGERDPNQGPGAPQRSRVSPRPRVPGPGPERGLDNSVHSSAPGRQTLAVANGTNHSGAWGGVFLTVSNVLKKKKTKLTSQSLPTWMRLLWGPLPGPEAPKLRSAGAGRPLPSRRQLNEAVLYSTEGNISRELGQENPFC